jgi:hypothetical protein
LLSCPSCGANQTDPLGFYPPPAASAKARLPAPQSSIKPQLAAPAAWKTAAGVADDQFYAKHDPWRTPNRHRWAWLVGALAALLLAAVWVAGYLVLTPGSDAGREAPKAVFGAVTTQQAAPSVGTPAASVANSVVPRPSVSTPPALAASKAVVPKAAEQTLAAQHPAVSKLAEPPPVVAPRPAIPKQDAAALARSKPPPQLVEAPTPVVPQVTATPKHAAPQVAVAPRLAAPQVTATPRPAAPPQMAVAPNLAAPQVAATPRPVAPPQIAVAPRPVAPQMTAAPRPPAPQPATPTPPVTLAAVPRATPAAPDARRDVKRKTDQPGPDVVRNLQIARAMLQKDNLSAAGSRLAAVIAVQPKNRDALAMSTDLSERQQQRDVALDVARGCENSGRWTCAWHHAGNALVIDSSSADAKRILARAMVEAEFAKAPAAVPAAVPGADPPRDLPYHH